MPHAANPHAVTIDFDSAVHRFALVIVSPRALPATSSIVLADAVEQRDPWVRVMREGQLRFQIASRDVLTVIGFPTQLAAADALREHRQGNHGGSTVHVNEYASAPRSRGVSAERAAPTTSRGGPAEGIGFRIDER